MSTPWVTTKEILEYLKCSRQTISRNMDLFSYGVHYRKVNPKNSRSPILWHLPKVEHAMCKAIVPK